MDIYGVDFTSSPSRRKPIVAAQCRLEDDSLVFQTLHRWTVFSEFEEFLASPGPWIAGFDFPFGQARRFIETIGWPEAWSEYVALAGAMSRRAFFDCLTRYRQDRPAGDREHRRGCDRLHASISPQKLHGTPVGLMFYEGAPRLLRSDVTVLPFLHRDPARIAVEAYPGALARRLIGKTPYKSDDRARQTEDRLAARIRLLKALRDPSLCPSPYAIIAPDDLALDPSGDALDALIAAAQASWSWSERERDFGIPRNIDRLEGWIVADPPE
jgi:hypothetical protein